LAVNDLEPLQFEDEAQHLAEPAIVVDDQDSKRLFRHQVSPFECNQPTMYVSAVRAVP